MSFYADLHVHSRFSRATSRDCDLENLALWAQRKGLAVLGTGDFTHPAWFAAIREKLTPAEPGLFRLRPDIERAVASRQLPIGGGSALAASTSPRFVLQVEISTIYKKGDRTRKVHHLIFAADLAQAEAVSRRLARIGNIKSDGRPILGLDSHDLLEITLEAGEGAFLVPAHVWTPWFSVFGANSGFDSVEECYDDLAPHVFALETGLSSDPPMNWRLSALDRYRLVSNSDCHSPQNLGREACVFDTELDFFSLRRALETGVGYGGTVEFFPEEGKYHLDGHRKCGVRFEPEQTRRHAGRCPKCGKPVTVGVMHRIADLADRPAGTRPPSAAPFRSLIPLAELLSQILGVGRASGKVWQAQRALVARLGPELFILEHAPLDELRLAGGALCAEAVARMRSGRVIREAGYDGEYGVIRVFGDQELRGEDKATRFLFDVAARPPTASAARSGRRGRRPARPRPAALDACDAGTRRRSAKSASPLRQGYADGGAVLPAIHAGFRRRAGRAAVPQLPLKS
jgi:DNA helicase-2/ATP-dependent DNA helicase PcrA